MYEHGSWLSASNGAKSAKKPGVFEVLEIWLLVCSGARISKEHGRSNNTILAFYFSDPFPVPGKRSLQL